MSKRASDAMSSEGESSSKVARLEEDGAAASASPSPQTRGRLTLDTIRKQLALIKGHADVMASWTSLRVGATGLQTSNWLADYRSTAYRPPHHDDFRLMVRHVLGAAYPRTPTNLTTRLTDKYMKRRVSFNGSVEEEWESPLELLIRWLFFYDDYQADFLALATELAGPMDEKKNELLGICCWAIVARQMPEPEWPRTHRQEEHTRSAVSNLVALILTFKGGPPFTYSTVTYGFNFNKMAARGDRKDDIWMPDFARHWFGLEMPGFCEEPSRIDNFLALLPPM